MKKGASEGEKQEYERSRSQNLTLAAFSIAALGFILSTTVVPETNTLFGIGYLSVAMFSFFIAAYLFKYRPKKWFPYIGETLELSGILCIGVGFYYVIAKIFSNNIPLAGLYLAFLVALIAIVAYSLRLNRGILKRRATLASNAGEKDKRRVTLRSGEVVDMCNYCDQLMKDNKCDTPGCPNNK
jgi:hypothetical protein